MDVRLPRQQFPLAVVAGGLALVLRAGTRLMRVPAVLALSWGWRQFEGAVASSYTVRLWLLRLGLHQLNRPKPHADDWIWIIDHTMQLGEWKCLIIVGIRQEAWNTRHRLLSQEDVDIIDLQPVKTSNEEVVYRQLETAARKTGIPREIVSDNGRDLQAGVKEFCKVHSHTVWLYDIKHKTANLLEHELLKDASWKAFLEQVNLFKQRVSVTALACLLPPQQRGKARYMNVDVLVEWATKHQALLNCPQVLAAATLDPTVVQEKLGWLRRFTKTLHRWREVLEVIEIVEHYVRHKGIHAQAAHEMRAILRQPASNAARRIRRQLLDFIAEEARQTHTDECLLGSSEVLESIIGKFKHLAGDRGQHGLTGIMLSIGALVGKVTLSAVVAAMTAVTNRDVWKWCQSHLGITLQGIRHRITQALYAEQNQPPLQLANR